MTEDGKRGRPMRLSGPAAPGSGNGSASVSDSEAWARTALGLDRNPRGGVTQQRADQARQRHRFVRDGEVKVVMVGNRPDAPPVPTDERVGALDREIEHLRAARTDAEKRCRQAQETARSLETQLVHTRMTLEQVRAELAAAQEWRLARQHADIADAAAEAPARARRAAAPRESQRDAAREPSRELPRDLGREAPRVLQQDPMPEPQATPELDREAVFRSMPPADVPAASAVQTRRGPGVGDAARPAGGEPEPVEWWLPGWQDRFRDDD